MSKVNSGGCISRLALKSLLANRTRNVIAVIAISLTTVLFTSLLTIAGTLMYSYQQETFRQSGGDMHGTFKSVTPEQIESIIADPLVVTPAVRRMLGTPTGDAFLKARAELSYMDEACAKGYFLELLEGAYPREGTKEIACDTRVLELLGITPELGAAVPLSYMLGTSGSGRLIEDTFTLCGWWAFDSAMQVSQCLVPLSYVSGMLEGYTPAFRGDTTGRWDLNVYLRSSMHIERDMLRILQNCGYQNTDANEENYISIGVNWAYVGSQLFGQTDPTTMALMAGILLVILLTGYLIIYNIFRISVTGDIRFYGLLKTIGTTPRQIRRIVRIQALSLCLPGIPLGLLLGYVFGTLLAPLVVAQTIYSVVHVTAHPAIFLFSALFSIVTVMISCSSPGRIAGRVSPVEALRYTESRPGRRALKRGRGGAKIVPMAVSNLGRSRSKTAMVVLSLSLAVVLLMVVSIFTNGFDMEKYLNRYVISDFILGHAQYFTGGMNIFNEDNRVPQEDIDTIAAQLGITGLGRVYGSTNANIFKSEERIRAWYSIFNTEDVVNWYVNYMEKDEHGNGLENACLYGMDPFALDHLEVVEGDLAPLSDPARRAIAVIYPDGDLKDPDRPYNLGDSVTVRYVDEWRFISPATGEEVDPDSGMEYVSRSEKYREVTYTVAAIVSIPQPMSYRYYSGDQFVLNAERLIEDSGTDDVMNVIFDVDDDHLDAMEAFMEHYTNSVNKTLSYESRQIYVDDFNAFRSTFIMLGGALCFIVGLVGVLNFFNAVMTSIMARRREFAVLSAIGMTSRQMRAMLIVEGILYTAMSLTLSTVLSLLLAPVLGNVLTELFFFRYRFSIMPIVMIAPLFLLLGILLPAAVYRVERRHSIVERLHTI